MKKLLIILIVIVTLVIVYSSLPLSVKRYSDIHYGNKLIDNIESYMATNTLPDQTDWNTLKSLGFQFDYEKVTPEYHKIDDSSYELIFIEGFDGPYLLWNNNDKIWKMDFPAFPKK